MGADYRHSEVDVGYGADTGNVVFSDIFGAEDFAPAPLNYRRRRIPRFPPNDTETLLGSRQPQAKRIDGMGKPGRGQWARREH